MRENSEKYQQGRAHSVSSKSLQIGLGAVVVVAPGRIDHHTGKIAENSTRRRKGLH